MARNVHLHRHHQRRIYQQHTIHCYHAWSDFMVQFQHETKSFIKREFFSYAPFILLLNLEATRPSRIVLNRSHFKLFVCISPYWGR